MQRRDYIDYRFAVTRLFTEVDPLGYAALGAPDDEYDDMITGLLKWRKPVLPSDVRAAVGEVDEEVAVKIADGIARIRHEFGYDPD